MKDNLMISTKVHNMATRIQKAWRLKRERIKKKGIVKIKKRTDKHVGCNVKF